LLGLHAPGPVADRAAAVLVGGGGVVLAIGDLGSLTVATGVGMLGIAGGAMAHIASVRIFGRVAMPAPGWFLAYLRTAYAWLGIASVLYAWQALGTVEVAGVDTL